MQDPTSQIIHRARLLAARSSFPDADWRLFAADALRDLMRGAPAPTECIDEDWSVAQHVRAT